MSIIDLDIAIKTEKGSLKKTIKEIQDDLRGVGDQVGEDIGKKVNKGILGGMKLAGASIIASGLNKVSSWALTLAGNLEQADVAFTTMLGSAEKSKKMLKDLSDFAMNTPFELTGIRQTAKQLLAYGIEAEKIIPTLKSLGDVSAGLSVPIEQVAYAYGQVKSAGRLLGQDLRQFTNAGVPLIQELAKNLGVAESSIKDMVSAGVIGFKDVEKAFQTMSGEGGRFANLMDKQSQTLMGAWSNLQDAMNNLGEVIGTLFIPILTKITQAISPLIENLKVWIEEHPKLAKVIGSFIAVGGTAIVVITGIGGAINMVGIALGGLAGPIGWIILAISGLTTGILALNGAFDSNKIKINTAGKSYTELTEMIRENEKAQKKLREEQEKGNISASEYNKKLKILQEEHGILANAQGETSMTLAEVSKEIDKVNKSKLSNQEKLARLQELQNQAIFTTKSLLNLRLELANISDTAQGFKDNAQGKFSWKGRKANIKMDLYDTFSWIPGVKNGDTYKQEILDKEKALSEQITNYEKIQEKALELDKQIEEVGKKIGGGNGGGGSGSGSLQKAGKEAKEFQKKIKDIQKEYDNREDRVSDFDIAYKKYTDEMQEYNLDVEKSIQEIGEKMKKVSEDLEQDLANLEGDFNEKTANKQEAFIRKMIQKRDALEKKQNSKNGLSGDESQDLIKTREIINNLTKDMQGEEKKHIEEIIAQEEKRIQMTESERELLDYKKEILELQQQYEGQKQSKINEAEEEKEKLQREINIRKSIGEFEKRDMLKNLEDLNKIRESEAFKKMQIEEQNLFIQLAKERIAKEEQKEKLLDQQRELADATINLQNNVHSILTSNLSDIVGQYQGLITQINSAISAQRRLNAERRKKNGYRTGGYTGLGGDSDIAGVVHKNEWVAPARMVRDMKPLFDNLELKRQGFKNGGYTTNKTQNNTITVNSPIDLELTLNKMNWKL